MTYRNFAANKRLLILLLTFVIAIIASYFFAFQNSYLFFMTAMLTSAVSRITPVRQGMLVILCLLVMTCLISFLIYHHIFNMGLMDIVMGGFIGIVINTIVFPPKIYKLFISGIIPLLNILIEYNMEIIKFILEEETQTWRSTVKENMMRALLVKTSQYPEWVFSNGFNPGLRSGYRYFLIELEQLTELFFSVDYYLHRGLENALLDKIKEPLILVLNNNNILLTALIQRFNNNKLSEKMPDYVTDMTVLSDLVKVVVPDNLVLLDISPDYVSLTAFFQDIKDMRQILLQLAAALPVDYCNNDM